MKLRVLLPLLLASLVSTTLPSLPAAAENTENQLGLSGWTEISFTASSVSRSNLPAGFNYRASEPLLQQNWLRLQRSIDARSAAPTFGFLSDTVLPGSDYRFTVARGLFDAQLQDTKGRANRYGFDPVQFYVEAYLPSVLEGLDIKVGRFFCQYGVESIDAPSNALMSHAYTFIYDPFTHTGGLATLQLHERWTVQGGLVLGSDVFLDAAAEPYGVATVKWTGERQKSSMLFSMIAGSGRYNRHEDMNNPNIFDIVLRQALTGNLSYAFEGLFGYQSNVPDIGEASWFGLIHYLSYQIRSELAGNLRFEVFNDSEGQRSGYAGSYSSLTAGISYKPKNNLILRPEVRYDYNASSRPFDQHHGLLLAAVDVIMRW